MANRVSQKVTTFVTILNEIAELSTATTLKVGAMSLHWKFQKIASFGYNGSYPGAALNNDTGSEEESLEPGQSGFVHAEVNMMAKFREHNPEDYIILLTHSPCSICSKVLINAGFRYIFWVTEYRQTHHLKMFDDLGIIYGNIEKLINVYPFIIREKSISGKS
jgi:dCMP deaminase